MSTPNNSRPIFPSPKAPYKAQRAGRTGYHPSPLANGPPPSVLPPIRFQGKEATDGNGQGKSVEKPSPGRRNSRTDTPATHQPPAVSTTLPAKPQGTVRIGTGGRRALGRSQEYQLPISPLASRAKSTGFPSSSGRLDFEVQPPSSSSGSTSSQRSDVSPRPSGPEDFTRAVGVESEGHHPARVEGTLGCQALHEHREPDSGSESDTSAASFSSSSLPMILPASEKARVKRFFDGAMDPEM
ncbi:hypothetical protein FRC00_014440 [Tulasnella sp. 408]|nr:hypothetical protein FRC00_014440 [Tulasnella sp. 408]